METTNELNQRIAKNLIHYRKSAGLTQAELAEKINYSDKSVSKWESGNGVPDVYTLMQLAKLYGVTLNAFVDEETPVQKAKKTTGLHVLIMLLSSGIVWLVASLIFAGLQVMKPAQGPWWLAFLFALPINAVVIIVYASIWKHRILNFLSVSTLVWTALVCLYLTCRYVSIANGSDYGALWCLFLIGIPLQVLEILWTFFRTLLRKQKNGGMLKTEKSEKSERTENESQSDNQEE